MTYFCLSFSLILEYKIFNICVISLEGQEKLFIQIFIAGSTQLLIDMMYLIQINHFWVAKITLIKLKNNIILTGTRVGAMLEHGETTTLTHFSWTTKLHTEKEKEKLIISCNVCILEC